MQDKIKDRYIARFGGEPILVKAPSRINLIGEHTDYNLGFALPAAVGQAMYFAIQKNDSDTFHIEAVDLDEDSSFLLEELTFEKGSWQGLFKTVLAELKSLGYEFEGVNCTFGGDIPIGAGMSSSSALNCGFIFGLNQLFGWDLTNDEIMKIASAAEYRYGVKGGLMDQFTILNGQEGCALLLNFKEMSYEPIPLQTGDYHFVLINTCVKHSLVNSPYNQRREACERVLDLMKESDAAIQSYQDFDECMLEEQRMKIEPDDFIKARYVLRENDRVLQAAELLKEGQLIEFGQLLCQSHKGLRMEYKVSCDELDFIIDHMKEMPGVLGSRMMGGGFGGCTVNLIHKDNIQSVWTDLSEAYFNQFGIRAEMYEVEVGEGIRLV